jgi:hypothetical protein
VAVTLLSFVERMCVRIFFKAVGLLRPFRGEATSVPEHSVWLPTLGQMFLQSQSSLFVKPKAGLPYIGLRTDGSMAVDTSAVIGGTILRGFLWAFWTLCTFAALVTALDLPFPGAFKRAVRLSAARGKTWQTRPKALGRLQVCCSLGVRTCTQPAPSVGPMFCFDAPMDLDGRALQQCLRTRAVHI